MFYHSDIHANTDLSPIAGSISSLSSLSCQQILSRFAWILEELAHLVHLLTSTSILMFLIPCDTMWDHLCHSLTCELGVLELLFSLEAERLALMRPWGITGDTPAGFVWCNWLSQCRNKHSLSTISDNQKPWPELKQMRENNFYIDNYVLWQ